MTATICIAAWFVLAAGYLVGNHRWNQRRARKEAEVVNWLPLLPPVPLPAHPRITQADVDATWLDQWPTDVEPADIDTLEQRVYDRLFDDIVACEGLQ